MLDILAPSSVDNGSRDYIVVDGIYHSYLYIAGYQLLFRERRFCFSGKAYGNECGGMRIYD